MFCLQFNVVCRFPCAFVLFNMAIIEFSVSHFLCIPLVNQHTHQKCLKMFLYYFSNYSKMVSAYGILQNIYLHVISRRLEKLRFSNYSKMTTSQWKLKIEYDNILLTKTKQINSMIQNQEYIKYYFFCACVFFLFSIFLDF